jgi:hypothetical protein
MARYALLFSHAVLIFATIFRVAWVNKCRVTLSSTSKNEAISLLKMERLLQLGFGSGWLQRTCLAKLNNFFLKKKCQKTQGEMVALYKQRDALFPCNCKALSCEWEVTEGVWTCGVQGR